MAASTLVTLAKPSTYFVDLLTFYQKRAPVLLEVFLADCTATCPHSNTLNTLACGKSTGTRPQGINN
jgi:hypothetical protein